MSGATAKVGIGNNSSFRLGGAYSLRAMKQIHALGGPTLFGHVVLIKISAGYMARAQAFILEKTVVSLLKGAGLPVDPNIHSSPVADDDLC